MNKKTSTDYSREKYISVRINKGAYAKIKKIQHKQELDSVVATIDYLVGKENI